MDKVLVVVDAQNDFIDGALPCDAANMAIRNIVGRMKAYPADHICLTLDSHDKDYLKTREGKYLPVEHCIVGTNGWDIHRSIKYSIDITDAQLIFKDTFGTLELRNSIKSICGIPKEIEVCGFATDICVLNNALMLRNEFPKTKITVRRDCCAGTTDHNHLMALDLMRINQIEII